MHDYFHNNRKPARDKLTLPRENLKLKKYVWSRGGGGHLYFRLDIILVKGLSKHTLNTYFSGMKIDPK